jgi:hypothetical protein
MQTADLLNEREASHGDFRDTSETAQALKNTLRNSANWRNMNGAQREALDMIANKLARVCNGDANFLDHWVDVAGYATLVARDLGAKAER